MILETIDRDSIRRKDSSKTWIELTIQDHQKIMIDIKRMLQRSGNILINYTEESLTY
ncbi:MAG: hypothetical protein AB7F53_01790 [Nitrososphaeraceae archaeon]